jgi:hypothetical protein
MKQRPRTQSITIGLSISILLIFAMSFYNSITFGEIFLHDALPHYGRMIALTETDFTSSDNPSINSAEESPPITIIGLDDVGIDFSTHYENLLVVWDSLNPRLLSPAHLENLRDPLFLRDSMYTVNNLTLFVPEMFDVDEFMAVDLRVNPQSVANGDPVVLIFHTHSTEMFIDSKPGDMFTGIVGVGAYLTKLLNARGIPAST